ncbi:MAG: hypothetical protein J5556_01435 [Deltaproteobacteria bacterium]|nr:hypothetical protein [Deltaproteobacteria bacterium]
MPCINLEPLCADYGMDFVDCDAQTKVTDKENVINKALGVLVENGFYAMSVFLLSCNQARYGEQVFDKLMDMLRDERLSLTRSRNRRNEALPDIRAITMDLPKLILARKVTEQALTFARYHCKAVRRNNGND